MIDPDQIRERRRSHSHTPGWRWADAGSWQMHVNSWWQKNDDRLIILGRMQIEHVLCSCDAGGGSTGQSSQHYLGAHAHSLFFSLSCPGSIRIWRSLSVSFVLLKELFCSRDYYWSCLLFRKSDRTGYVYTAAQTAKDASDPFWFKSGSFSIDTDLLYCFYGLFFKCDLRRERWMWLVSVFNVTLTSLPGLLIRIMCRRLYNEHRGAKEEEE